jgi:hypothetical protein
VSAREVRAGGANGSRAELKMSGDEIDLAVECRGRSGAEGLAPKLALLSRGRGTHIDAREQARAEAEWFCTAEKHGTLREVGERSSSKNRLGRCARLQFDKQRKTSEHRLAFEETGQVFALGGSGGQIAGPQDLQTEIESRRRNRGDCGGGWRIPRGELHGRKSAGCLGFLPEGGELPGELEMRRRKLVGNFHDFE